MKGNVQYYREVLRRQLFADFGEGSANNTNVPEDEDAIELEGSYQSQDELERNDHDTDSQIWGDELSEVKEEEGGEILNRNIIIVNDNKTVWIGQC